MMIESKGDGRKSVLKGYPGGFLTQWYIWVIFLAGTLALCSFGLEMTIGTFLGHPLMAVFWPIWPKARPKKGPNQV